MKVGQTPARAVLLCASLALLLSCERPAPLDPRVRTFATLPNWDGYWSLATMRPEIYGFDARMLSSGNEVGQKALESLGQTYPLAGTAAPWNDAGRARFFAVLGSMAGRKADGWGYPMMMGGAAPLQFHISPEETLILNMYREVRHIYTDGRSLVPEADRWVTTWGESIGRWEGDTLVIETVGVRYPPDFFQLAPPLSENARYMERIRRTGADTMESDVTIEDPETLTGPWHAKVSYIREKQLDRLVHDVFTNDRSELDGNAFTIEPPKK
jgi:hypothetical protein